MKITGISKEDLQHCLNQFERFSNTYFWTPPQSASGRRSEEKRNSNTWTFFVNDAYVKASIDVSCSCKNYYATRCITVAGTVKKMMIPYLKKLLEKGEFDNA